VALGYGGGGHDAPAVGGTGTCVGGDFAEDRGRVNSSRAWAKARAAEAGTSCLPVSFGQ
jgi:hypothetical protein